MEIKSYAKSFFSLVYPEYCSACGDALYRNESVLCTRCLAELPRTGFHRDPENEVARMFWGRVPIVHATSFIYFAKGSRFRQILHELKYNDQPHTGYVMGRMFGNELKDTPFARVDIVHPVPLHPSRLKSRGYNQSERIAAGMCDALHLRLETDCLARTRATHTQTRRSRYERWENVGHMFVCSKPQEVVHKHVLLIDDVITTGATLEACSQCLVNIEGTRVSIATLAYARLQS